jgi:gliding motility-associated-like protein
VQFIITPYTREAGSDDEKCTGENDTARVWVEPTPKVNVSLNHDTICNDDKIGIILTSPSVPTREVRFTYELEIPYGVSVFSDSSFNLGPGYLIADSIHNSSDTAKLVRYTIIPYTRRAENDNMKCPGLPEIFEIWVEPTAKIFPNQDIDTICDEDFINVGFTSPTVATIGIEFNVLAIPDDAGSLSGYSDKNKFTTDSTVYQQLINSSDVPQRIIYILIPYTLDDKGQQRCEGLHDTITAWVAPELLVVVDSISKYKARLPELQKNVSCHEANDGFIRLLPVGGITAFSGYDVDDLTYSWSNSQTTKDAENLTAGEYWVTINDKLNCADEDTFTLTQPEKLLASIEIIDTLSCNASDGTIMVQITGGTEGYKPEWQTIPDNPLIPDPPYVADTLYNINSGYYLVNVYDTNNCLKAASSIINEPTPVDIQMIPDFYDYRVDKVFHIKCHGESNGKLNLVNNSGTLIDYHLTGPEIDTTFSDNNNQHIFQNLMTGTYSLHYEDMDQCEGNKEITLQEPDTLTLAGDSVSLYYGRHNVTCFGSGDGSIYLQSITGGHDYAGYSFYWETVTGEGEVVDTNRNQFDLPAGTYAVQITDTFGCSISDTFELVQPEQIIINYEVSMAPDNFHNINCHGDATGFINLLVTGGDTIDNPYTYSWSHGPRSGQINNLVADVYSVEVTDGINCTADTSISLAQPPILLIDSSRVSDYNSFGITCTDSSNGYINIYTSGGSGTHEFEWKRNDTLFPGNNSYLNNIPAGVYDLTVTDTNGCTVEWTDTLKSPSLLMVSIQLKNVDCSGKIPGYAKATGTGGVGGYSYEWSTGAKTDSIYNLGTGMYYVTVTDINECFRTDSAMIEQDPDLIITIRITDTISCNGYSDGRLRVNVNDGLEPYTYKWNDGRESQVIDNIATGTYTVEVIDDKGCKGDESITVEEPAKIGVILDIRPVSCHGYSDGEIEFEGTGGNGGYTYTWEGTTIGNNRILNLESRNYSIRVTDTKNCLLDTIITIPQPDRLTITKDEHNSVNTFCPDWPNGVLTADVQGGTPEYTYTWEFNTSIDSPTITDILPGLYAISVRDANNCNANSTLELASDNPTCLDIPTAFTPNSDFYNDYWDIDYKDANNNTVPFYDVYPNAEILIYNRWGKLVFKNKEKKEWETEFGKGVWDGKDMNGTDLPVDTYYYVIYFHDEKNSKPSRGIVTIIK